MVLEKSLIRNKNAVLLKDVEIRLYGHGGSIPLEALVIFTGEVAGVFLSSKQSFQNQLLLKYSLFDLSN